MDYVRNHFGADFLMPPNVDKLTYVQCLEIAGLWVPTSPRERNALNLVAALPATAPVAHSLCVFDLSQTITRAGMRLDGTVPTLGQNSYMWSMRDGRALNAYELAELMGHRTGNARYDGVPLTQAAFKQRLGLGVHVAVCGSMMMMLLASTVPRQQ